MLFFLLENEGFSAATLSANRELIRDRRAVGGCCSFSGEWTFIHLTIGGFGFGSGLSDTSIAASFRFLSILCASDIFSTSSSWLLNFSEWRWKALSACSKVVLALSISALRSIMSNILSWKPKFTYTLMYNVIIL